MIRSSPIRAPVDELDYMCLSSLLYINFMQYNIILYLVYYQQG